MLEASVSNNIEPINILAYNILLLLFLMIILLLCLLF